MNNRMNMNGLVTDEFSDKTAAVVVIIGESLSKNHCSLYGYCRPTTPRLEKRNDVIVYQNIRSAAFMTQEVLQQILTFMTKQDPDARWNKPSLPELLNAAGWHTYWYEPYSGKHDTSNAIPTGFQSISKLCTSYHLGRDGEQYDESHLDHLVDALNDSTSKRKAIFLHLIGNHFPYDARYPQTFKYFTDDDICSPYVNRLNHHQKAVVNAYDNAVRYNDWLIDSVLNILSCQTGSCAMLYFSDHGEEIYDYDFYAGRSFNHITNSLYEIPCILWTNDSYRDSNHLYINSDKSYCTGDMIHSLLDLFAVTYSAKDTCRSLFRYTTNSVDE